MATRPTGTRFPRLINLSKNLVLTTVAGASAFTIWTRNCHFVDIENALDSVVDESSKEIFRANPNVALFDVCERRVPMRFLKKELVHDADIGGGKLVEAFCQGLFGGRVYTPQRLIHKAAAPKTSSETARADGLWDRASLLQSTYPEGLTITKKFTVLKKSRNSILTLADDENDSHAVSDAPAIQVYVELSAMCEPQGRDAIFRIKTIFWQTGEGIVKPAFGLVHMALHKIYTKALMQDAVSNTLE